MRVLIVMALAVMLSGCAQPQTGQKEMLLTFSHALKNCGESAGCVAGVQAAAYSGLFREQQQDTIVNIAAAMLPWGRILLDGMALYKGTTGSSSQGMIVKGNNNQFIGFNRTMADRSASIYSPFDATATPSVSQSWTDMHNQDNIRSQNQ
jgi:hypothetical protein